MTRGIFFFRLMFTCFMVITLVGCAGTSTLYSNTFVKPAQPLSNFKVLYLENKLVAKRGGSGAAPLAGIGYNDLPELFRERVPIVFGMNGLSSEYATIQKADFRQKEAFETVRWIANKENAPLLVIQMVDGSSSTYQGVTLYDLNLHANLFTAPSQTRQWTGQFQNSLKRSALRRVGFDNEFVDEMLRTILQQMVKDGFIKVKDDKILIPPKASPNGQ